MKPLRPQSVLGLLRAYFAKSKRLNSHHWLISAVLLEEKVSDESATGLPPRLFCLSQTIVVF
ncbi:hypothetical protein ACSS6W_001524 [Trichoderma asperelloides]